MKPSEVKLVAQMLEQEHPDATSLAKEIIRALDDKRKEDDLYVLMAQLGQLVIGWGPYPTSNKAHTAATKMVSPSRTEPLPYRVVHLKRDTPTGDVA